MSVKWTQCHLGDLITLQRGYDLPEHRRETGSVPVVGSAGVTGHHSKARAPGPGVTVGRSGASFGVAHYCPTDFWPHNTVLFVTDFFNNDERFVYYLLSQLPFESYNSGSAQPSLNRNFLYSIPIRVPDLQGQQRIVDVLSAYDDLIENNTRRIQVLEDMAQAIYREWFVNFRFPGHEQVEMVESEMGLIPFDWDPTPLFDVAEVRYGFPFKSKQFTTGPEGMPVIRIRDVPNNASATFTSEAADDRYLVRDGDLLVGMDGEFHRAKWAGGEAYLNQRVARFRPKGSLAAYYLFLALKAPIEFFNATITGTTVAHLGDAHLRQVKLAIPPPDIAAQAKAMFDPIFDLEINLRRKNTRLRQTRDLLLPRLVSGELNVEDLDIETGELAA